MRHILPTVTTSDEVSMCVVGAPCETGWAETPPPRETSCPPADSQNADGQTMYRLVATIPPTGEDFRSRRSLDSSRHFTEAKCIDVALSVWTTVNKCEQAKRWPTLRDKQVSAVRLAPGSGVLRKLSQAHYSWWRCGAFDAVAHTRALGPGEA